MARAGEPRRPLQAPAASLLLPAACGASSKITPRRSKSSPALAASLACRGSRGVHSARVAVAHSDGCGGNLQGSIAIKGEGLYEGLDWLAAVLKSSGAPTSVAAAGRG